MTALLCENTHWYDLGSYVDCVVETAKLVVQKDIPVVSIVVKKFMDLIEGILIEAIKGILKALNNMWIEAPSPKVGRPTKGNSCATSSVDVRCEPVGVIAFLQVHTAWIMVAVATIAILIAGFRLALAANVAALGALLRSLLTMVIVTGGTIVFVQVLLDIGDTFAVWAIKESLTDSGFEGKMNDLIVAPLEDGGGLLTILVMGLLIILTTLVQVVMMLIRYAMIVLLVGILPIAASATNTEIGMAWFKRSLGWLTAFILYKPFAAIIYATGFMLEHDGPPWLGLATGISVMALSVVALPALLSLLAPPIGR
jgi:hypothetical protein